MRLKPDTDPASVIDPSLSSLWRYWAVLPIRLEASVSLTEGWTPLVRADQHTWVKDESRNPTGSFKARGMSMAVSAALGLGVDRLVAPSAGNAAGALAAYGAAAGVDVLVAMPDDTPRPFVEECRQYGAQVELVAGTISDSGKWLAENRSPGDFDLSTLKEPFRVEGKKTMGYELWEQFDGDLPEVIIYPTGGGRDSSGCGRLSTRWRPWVGSAPGAPGWFRCSRMAARRSSRGFETTWNGPSPGPIPSPPHTGFECPTPSPVSSVSAQFGRRRAPPSPSLSRTSLRRRRRCRQRPVWMLAPRPEQRGLPWELCEIRVGLKARTAWSCSTPEPESSIAERASASFGAGVENVTETIPHQVERERP